MVVFITHRLSLRLKPKNNRKLIKKIEIMDIKSLFEYTKFDKSINLYDLSTPSFIYDDNVPMKEFTVDEYHEMRIDLIFKSMYELEDNEINLYLKNIDVILYINNILNPLSIVRDSILIYPSKLEYLNKFRYELTQLEEDILTKKEMLSVPSKSTKADTNRKNYTENGYLVPPVVMDIPKSPVRINNGKFSVGGL